MPSRRTVLQILGFGVGALPGAIWAQSYPNRPVRIIVPLPPGSTSDIAARLIAECLSERLGQRLIVENRRGAGTNIGTEAAVRSAADGYSLLSTGSSTAINATLYDKLSFNFLRDMIPIASFMRVPNVLEVHPAVPARTVAEFVAYAKAHPGALNMASPGNGSTPHVAGELFKMMTNIDLVHVPYRSGALADLVAGHVQVMFDTLPASLGQIRGGKVRALAVTSQARSVALPGLPTVAETLKGYEASSWFGLSAPTGIPAAIVQTLNREINASLMQAEIKSRISEMGGDTLAGSPDDFRKLISDETEKWA